MTKDNRFSQRFWASFRSDARITARTFSREDQLLTRERPLVFLRPPGDDDPDVPDPDEDPPEPGDPCGQPFVHAPIVAAQIDLSFGLGNNQSRPCPSAADQERIVAAVRSQFRSVMPNADVRVACAAPLLTIAVWDPFNGNPCELAARQRGLERLSLLDSGEGFGFMLRTSLIKAQAARSFELAPKHYSGNGAPSSIGPIHLTGLSVEFREPDTVVTRLTGYDDRPLPDVGFTVIITDTILDKAEATTTQETDPDDGDIAVAILSLLFLGLSGALLTPLLFPVVFWVIAGDLEAARSAGSSDGLAGVGRRALGLVPKEIPLPARKMLEVTYQRRRVNKAAMFFGGFVVERDRQPEAVLVAPSGLVIGDEARHVSGRFQVAVAGTFGTVTVNWLPGDGFTVERPNSRETTIVFARGDLTAEDPPAIRSVRVRVSDQDGFTVELTRDVQIFVEDDDRLPPICRVHPSLPQCLPPQP